MSKKPLRSQQQPKRRPSITIAIPASLVADTPHLREKTIKIGWISRALAIFRVDKIVIYPDKKNKSLKHDLKTITSILSYMETPQYIRKILFKIKPELRYVGILPPLRTPHHPLQKRKRYLKVGEYREGVVVSVNQKGSQLEVGIEHPIYLPKIKLPVDTRITVRITNTGKIPKAELINLSDIKLYWGYRVYVSDVPLGQMIKQKKYDLVIATSRFGESYAQVAKNILSRWKESKQVLLAFGSPTHGLQEIVKREKLELKDLVDFIINTIPKQATATVRTEEALYTTLACLNLLTTSE
jgi:predicted SPOUT superfamily RNA methylase MTH1